MTRRLAPRAALCLAALANGCAQAAFAAQVQPPAAPVQAAAPPASSDAHVSTTIVPGAGVYPPPPTAPASIPQPGPVNLNFPTVDVQDFARAVLGGVLGLPFAVDPSVHGAVTLVTPSPVARSAVLPRVEDALKASNMALEVRGGVYTIVPIEQAKVQAPSVGPDQPGFGNETITLHYANPVELKKLFDPIIPGVITATDAAAGTMVVSGSSGQRKAVRELAEQFDLDWLKGMSFALFVPKNTDARLIAPELEKLINAPGATTAGLVRLIAMERLNGIVAIASRPQYLEDVRRWVEVLDREGQSSERRLYVYRVQNGRAVDLANVLVSAFGGSSGGGAGQKPTSERRPFGDSSTGLASGSTSGMSGGLGSGGFGSGSSGSGLGSPDGFSPPSGASTSGISLGAGQTLPGQSPSPPGPGARSGATGEGLVITSDETNNAVVAYATPREYALIEDALRKLDIPPLQVVIEAAISEITLNDALQYGTQWFFRAHGNEYGLTQGTGSTSPSAFASNLPGFVYSTISTNGNIAATISALSSVTHVKMLSSPNLMVLNNETASLQVGDEVPISTGSSQGTLVANSPVVNSVSYEDTGVILKVTPRVNSSGVVLLDISGEVSQVDTTATTMPSNPIDSPVIEERKIASSIAVQDGQTVAIGGLIQDQDSQTRTGVPILSAIPVLGALVGNRNNTRTRTELLVLLTPRVIRSPDEAKAVTEELKQKIKWVEPLRPKFEP